MPQKIVQKSKSVDSTGPTRIPMNTTKKGGKFTGPIKVVDSTDQTKIEMKATRGGSFVIYNAEQKKVIEIASRPTGTILLFDPATGKKTFHLDSNGNFLIATAKGKRNFSFSQNLPHAWIGEHIFIDGVRADLHVGRKNMDGTIFVKNGKTGEKTVVINGQSGDIELAGADCAEEFTVSDSTNIEPGSVLVVQDEEALHLCNEPYDRKVAGVVSGAGKFVPGLVLDRSGLKKNRMPIAMMGKVYCRVDAGFSSIRPGDLLTTSPTLGHAMRADDPQKSFGAVLGKALKGLPKGCDLIPILVTLQ